MALEVVTGPVEVPVSLEEYKDHLRVALTEDDVLIASLGSAAVGYTEETTSRALVDTQYKLICDSIVNNFIELPRSNATSITSVTQIDKDGASNVVPSSVYMLNKSGVRNFVVLNVGQSWPSVDLQAAGGIEVVFNAGYADAAAVPETLKSALKLMVSHLYEFREPVVTGTMVNSVPFTYDALVAPFTVPRVF